MEMSRAMIFTLSLFVVFMLMLLALLLPENPPTDDSKELLMEIKTQLGELTNQLPKATEQHAQQKQRDASIQQKLSELKMMLGSRGHFMAGGASVPDAVNLVNEPSTADMNGAKPDPGIRYDGEGTRLESLKPLAGDPNSIPYIAILTSYKDLALKALLDSIDVPVQHLHVIQNPLSSNPDGAGKVAAVAELTKKGKFPQLTLIDNGYNAGFAYSANIGLKFCKSLPWCLIIEDDALFEPGMLKLLIVHMHQPSNTDLLVAMDPARAAAGFAVRREFHKAVGLFDENIYPAYTEDCDLFLRMRQAGYNLFELKEHPFSPSWDSVVPSASSEPIAAVVEVEKASLGRSVKKNHCYFRKNTFMHTRPFGNALRGLESWDQNRQLRESHIKDWYEQPGWLLSEFHYKKGHEEREGRDKPGAEANCDLPGFI